MKNAGRFIMVAAAAGAAALWAAGSGATAADAVRVAGTVVDGWSGAPIPGIAVNVSDGAGTSRTAMTDKHGRYSVIGLSYGAVKLELTRKGFAPEAGSIAIPSGESAKCDFQFYSYNHSATTLESRPENDDRPTCRIEPDTSDKYIIQ